MQAAFRLLLLFTFIIPFTEIYAQVSPVVVTGFNNDAIAEAGPNSLTTTTLQIDGGSSNKVMYTNAFRIFAGIAGGGLPDNGTITSGGDTYQLANYAGNNALYVYRNETRALSLATPSSYARVRVLALTTEGLSSLNISLSFTDGTTSNYLTGYTLSDWFNGTGNLVLQGFGRCDRSTGPLYNADAFPSNPRMYYIDIPLNCTDKSKLLQSITFANVSTMPNNAPFPNAVFMAVSGIGYTQNIVPAITPSDCNGPNGSIALTVTGSTSPYTYSWNTLPVQTGATATGLAPGNYTCTITDAANCITTYNGVVPLNINGSITATASPLTICPGEPVTLSINVLNGAYTIFGWRPVITPLPPYTFGQIITVNPTVTTTYEAAAQIAAGMGWWTGCFTTALVTVTVNPTPVAPVVNNVPICTGTTATLQVQSPQAGYAYNWYDAATGGTLLATGTSYTTPVLTANTSYYVGATNSTNCTSAVRTTVTVIVENLPTAPQAIGATICPGSTAILSVTNPQPGFTYNWYDVATGGIPLATGVTFSVSNVTTNITYYAEAVSAGNCVSSSRTAVAISLLQQLQSPVVTVTNTTFTSLTFSWNAIAGATGYEVTTNGGATYQIPSSGSLGTTHTINGLSGNTTVVLQVRALKNFPCEISLLSNPVAGTTLSSKEIFVPNVFTPNGDGRNDVLLVYGNYVGSIQLRIFNQWGQLIFSSDNISTGWNGTVKGQPQPVGVYAYTLKVVLQDGTVVNKKGSINLIR